MFSLYAPLTATAGLCVLLAGPARAGPEDWTRPRRVHFAIITPHRNCAAQGWSTMNATEGVVRFITEMPPESLPPETITAAKRALLDTTGVTLAGVPEDGPAIVRRLAAENGPGPVSILGTAQRAQIADAALATGTAAHALDYDDTTVSLHGHPSAPLLPAVFALAEARGRSGAALIDAFVIGFEVEANLGSALGDSSYHHGWHQTATAGTLGVAAACARLAGLSAEQTMHALGIAVSLASGSRENFGSMTKPLHVGNAARSGLQAVLLAELGFTAAQDSIGGPLGFVRLFTPEGDERPERLDSLGEGWGIVDPGVNVKRYPCCYGVARSADLMFALVEEHDLQPEQIERVDVRVHPGGLDALFHSRPQDGLQGKFSMEYVLAAVVVDRALRLSTFEDEAVTRPEARRVIERVHPSEGAPPPEIADAPQFAQLAVTLVDGTRLERAVDEVIGSSTHPLSWDELAGKYRDTASRVLDEQAVERSLEGFADFESTRDVGGLVAELCPSGNGA